MFPGALDFVFAPKMHVPLRSRSPPAGPLPSPMPLRAMPAVSLCWLLAAIDFGAAGASSSDGTPSGGSSDDGSLHWLADMGNLSFDALSSAEVLRLSTEYATTIANELGLAPGDISDDEGRTGRVTLAKVSAGVAASGASTDSGVTEASTAAPTTSMPAGSTTAAAAGTTAAAASSTAASGGGSPNLPEPLLPGVMQPLRPLRGIAYGALPCTEHDCGGGGRPSEDMLQTAYSMQWSAAGRDDLGVIARLGGNAVRLYHSLGMPASMVDLDANHDGFLDRAQELGLNVLPGYHTEAANDPDACPGFDCFEHWKAATLRGFQHGFSKSGAWHPAIGALILLNEPDFFEHAPKCVPSGAWCRVKAVLSALDGVLAAEREADVSPGRVRLTVTWSFAIKTSIDGTVEGPGVFGFQDVIAGIADPALAGYAPRSTQAQLQHAFDQRWVHGLNTQSPWNFVNEMVSKDYAQFAPVPWFIGEYGGNGQSKETIQADLISMQQAASEQDSVFLGAAFFQFETTYWKGGAEMNFGLFSLGDDVLGQTGTLAGRTWPVHCLSTALPWLSGSVAERAAAVAGAWGGQVALGHAACGAAAQEGAGSPSPDATGSDGGNAEAESTSTSAAPPVTQPPILNAEGLPVVKPLRGIAYGALPCTSHACGGQGLASEDMLQEGYAMQWGAQGRDDLGVMAGLGANAVRLYHSFGLNVQKDHGAFLDHAQASHLNVMAGFHTELANDPTECPAYDCFDAWKAATLQGFQYGFKAGGDWHPAVSALILLNEPDFFDHAPKCVPSGPWCRVKAALSALDGVLAAEAEAGVAAGRVRLTVTWSFAMKTSIDGTVTGPGTFGFQDMVAGVADPSLAGYTPRASLGELRAAFQERWLHGLNTQSPWNFVNEMVSKDYARFAPVPWFIGEYGANGQLKTTIQENLESMEAAASQQDNYFMGAAVFQFQTTYWKGGAEMNFGLYSLGADEIGQTDEVCDKMSPNCRRWPVYCLSTDLSWLPGTMGQRAAAVAAAWGGVVTAGPGHCSARRLANVAEATRVSCEIHGAAADLGATNAALAGEALAGQLSAKTREVLGEEHEAITGQLLLTSQGTRSVNSQPGRGADGAASMPVWLELLIGGICGLVAFGACAGCVMLVRSTFRDEGPAASGKVEDEAQAV